MIHKDERGIIKDLFVGKKWALTYITFTKGAVRGNHYHKHTTQWDFVLWGQLFCKTISRNKILWPLMFIKHPSPIPHAYYAITNAKMLTFVIGERRGEDYSKDTYKYELLET